MLAIIPSAGGEVDPTEKRGFVVDGDDLLVMAGTQRMVEVEFQGDPLVVAPIHPAEHLQALAGVDRPHAPNDEPHLQVRPAFDQAPKPLAERRAVRIFRSQSNIRIKVPADDEDRAPGMLQNLVQAAEVIGSVDQKGSFLSAGTAPCIVSGLDDWICTGFLVCRKSGCCHVHLRTP